MGAGRGGRELRWRGGRLRVEEVAWFGCAAFEFRFSCFWVNVVRFALGSIFCRILEL
jgi:hypothetical protein